MSDVYVIENAPATAPNLGCMGGWCAQELRSICVHYQRTDARHLDERMCMSSRADEFQRIGGAAQRTPENA